MVDHTCVWLDQGTQGLEKCGGDRSRNSGKRGSGMMRWLGEVKGTLGRVLSGVMGAGRTCFARNVSFLVSALES